MEKETPSISVVIPAYNAATTLPLQLQALDEQEDAPPFEVIVVDNGSTDATAEVARHWRNRVLYPMRIVTAAAHQGPGYARNVGAAVAQADRLMFADADDVVSRWWVRTGVLAFDSSDFWSGAAVPLTPKSIGVSIADARSRIGDHESGPDLVSADLDDAFPVVMGCNFGITREAFERIGGFDHSHGTAFEDNDLGLRAHLLGIGVDHARGVRIAYRVMVDGRKIRRRIRMQARGHELDVMRYGLEERSTMDPPGIAFARTAAIALLMAAGARQRDRQDLSNRLAAAAGMLEARVRYRWLRGAPEPSLGLGYLSTEPSR